jgi:transposase-like protein
MMSSAGEQREPVGRPQFPSREQRKEDTMSVTDKNQPVEPSSPYGRKKRRFLSAEKKFQLFLETQRAETPVGEVLRREGLYSTDLARIQRMVKEGALERLAARPGPAKKTVCRQDYDALKQELQDKERVIAEMAVELAILRKKTNGGSWER